MRPAKVKTSINDDGHVHEANISERTRALWWSRAHVFGKNFTLGHAVARNISNQPVMPFSKLGVLAAWSIWIW
jgi:hypothetical protein